MNYRDFEIQLSGESPNHFSAKVMDKGNAIAAQTFELRTGELKVIEGLQRLEEKAVASAKKETFHIEFGKELYNKVFTGKLGEYFKNCLEEAQDNDIGLRICLKFDESAQEIAVLPWEFLHDGRDFLVTSRNTLISRLPSGIKKIKKAPLESILRMLVVISSPDDPRVAPLNTELEQEVILEAVDKLQRDHKMEVDFTEDATFETIQGYLNEKDYHIVHFTGHGTFDDEKGKGYLVLETGDGKARMVDNAAVADLLEGRGVRLVVLSACQSGKTSNKEAYADLATILAKNKIPAVAAMQYSILDLSATKFASIFYQAIASGKPVDLALTEARIAMKNAEKSNGVDFATPVLYLCDPDCLAVSKIKPETPELFNKPMMLGDMALMKKGFVGRRKELRLLQNDFMSDLKRAAIIYGFGGLGKTVLATRLALRMNQHFDGVFGMKCSSTTKSGEVLNRLNAFLLVAGIQQLNQILCQPVPLEAKTAMLVKILNQRRFLIIFDNFEDCLDESRCIIANPELKEFIQQLINNTVTNTKFIITSRYNFDPLEGRLTGNLEHMSLPELALPQTVWLMNNYKELADLRMEEKHGIYRVIGGHPWTIGQFARLADTLTVDGLMIELEHLKKELINFTLLDKSYSKLDEKTRALFLRTSIYQDAVPVEALSWIMGDEQQPSPSITKELEKLINWGMISKQTEGEETLYMMHTLVRDFAKGELNKEVLDRKQIIKRAAQHYENKFTSKNILYILKAVDYYYEAEEWGKANEIVNVAWKYLVQLGYIEVTINLLTHSINTSEGTTKAVALGNLAIIYNNLGDWKTAFKKFTEVKEIFETEGDNLNVARVLHMLAITYQEQGNYDEAIKLYQQSLKIKEELGDNEGIAQSLHQLGTINQEQGNYDEAIKLYQQSLKIKEELEDNEGIALILYNLGTLCQTQGNYDEAIKLYQQSLKKNEVVGNERLFAKIIQTIGALHRKHGNYDENIKLNQHRMKMAKKQQDKQGIAQSLHEFGTIHQKQGNYTEAIKLYQQSLKIKEELGDKPGIAPSLHQLGTIHQEQGNYDEAIKLYQQSLKIDEELGNKQHISNTLHQLGIIHYDQGNYDEAIKLYQQSYELRKELEDNEGIAKSLHEFGTIYGQQGNYDEAIKLYQQSLKINEELGNKQDIARTLHNLGMIHQEQGNFAEAINLYKESLEIQKELGDKPGIAQTLHQLGTIQKNQGNYQEAGKLYEQSLKLSKELGNKSSIAYTLYQLGMIYHYQENFQGAGKLYEESLEIQKELKDKRGIAYTLHQFGNIQYQQGNYQDAENLYQQSLEIKNELRDKRGIAQTLHQLGMIYQNQGNYQDAAKLYQKSLKISTELEDKSGIASSLGELGRIDEKFYKNFPGALEKYLLAVLIFKELNSPNSNIALNNLARLKKKMGEEASNKALEEIMRKHDT